MRRAAFALALALAPAVAAAPATAQQAGDAPGPTAAPLLVVDLDRALRESDVGEALRDAEVAERRALQERFDALKAELEAREAEMVELRKTLPKAEFDRLVVEFDLRVRAERRGAQQAAAALQARFAAAQAALQARIQPLLADLMTERGAQVVLGRDAALAVAPTLDVTDALMDRLDATLPDPSALLPPTPGDGATP